MIPISSENPYAMIIITDATRYDNEIDDTYGFHAYAAYKTSKGIKTGIVKVEDIYANYDYLDPAFVNPIPTPTIDGPMMIRNFIKDAYETFAATETPLEYIMLGGKIEIVPAREFYGYVHGATGIYEQWDIHGDIYYSNLDGTFWTEGKNWYGVFHDNGSHNFDLFADVYAGRIPAITALEFNNFFNKSCAYQNEISETRHDNILIWAGRMPPCTCTSFWDINRNVFHGENVRGAYNTTFLCSRDYSPESGAPGTKTVEEINKGIILLLQTGHSGIIGNAMITNELADDITLANGYIHYGGGCLSGIYDFENIYLDRAIGEYLVTHEKGAVAFIGNSRVGWAPTSWWLQKQFLLGLFEQKIKELGKAFHYSKEILLSFSRRTPRTWLQWSTNFFGDPSIQMKGTFIMAIGKKIKVSWNDIDPTLTHHYVLLRKRNSESWKRIEGYDLDPKNRTFEDKIFFSGNYVWKVQAYEDVGETLLIEEKECNEKVSMCFNSFFTELIDTNLIFWEGYAPDEEKIYRVTFEQIGDYFDFTADTRNSSNLELYVKMRRKYEEADFVETFEDIIGINRFKIYYYDTDTSSWLPLTASTFDINLNSADEIWKEFLFDVPEELEGIEELKFQIRVQALTGSSELPDSWNDIGETIIRNKNIYADNFSATMGISIYYDEHSIWYGLASIQKLYRLDLNTYIREEYTAPHNIYGLTGKDTDLIFTQMIGVNANITRMRKPNIGGTGDDETVNSGASWIKNVIVHGNTLFIMQYDTQNAKLIKIPDLYDLTVRQNEILSGAYHACPFISETRGKIYVGASENLASTEMIIEEIDIADITDHDVIYKAVIEPSGTSPGYHGIIVVGDYLYVLLKTTLASTKLLKFDLEDRDEFGQIALIDEKEIKYLGTNLHSAGGIQYDGTFFYGYANISGLTNKGVIFRIKESDFSVLIKAITGIPENVGCQDETHLWYVIGWGDDLGRIININKKDMQYRII